MRIVDKFQRKVVKHLTGEEYTKWKHKRKIIADLREAKDALKQVIFLGPSSLQQQYRQLYRFCLDKIAECLRNDVHFQEFPNVDSIFTQSFQQCASRILSDDDSVLSKEYLYKSTELLADLFNDVGFYLNSYIKSSLETRAESITREMLMLIASQCIGIAVILTVLIISWHLGVYFTERMQSIVAAKNTQAHLESPFVDIFLRRSLEPPFGTISFASMEMDQPTHKQFVWGLGPATVVTFMSLRSQPMILKYTMSNPCEGQSVYLFINGKLAKHYNNLAKTTWLEPAVSDEVYFQSIEGNNTIRFNYDMWNKHPCIISELDDRPLAMAITGLRIEPTRKEK